MEFANRFSSRELESWSHMEAENSKLFHTRIWKTLWCSEMYSVKTYSNLISHWQNHTAYGHTAAPVHDGRSTRGSTVQPAHNVLPINQINLLCILTLEVVEVTFVHAVCSGWGLVVMRTCKQKEGGGVVKSIERKREDKWQSKWIRVRRRCARNDGRYCAEGSQGLQVPELIGQLNWARSYVEEGRAWKAVNGKTGVWNSNLPRRIKLYFHATVESVDGGWWTPEADFAVVPRLVLHEIVAYMQPTRPSMREYQGRARRLQPGEWD